MFLCSYQIQCSNSKVQKENIKQHNMDLGLTMYIYIYIYIYTYTYY